VGRLIDELAADAVPWGAYAEQVVRSKPSRKAIAITEYPLPAPYNRRRKDLKEADVLRAVLADLSSRKVWHRRIQIQGVIQRTGAGEGVMRPSTMTGMPDVIALHRGIFLGLEVKKPGGKLAAHQLQTLTDIRDAGGIGAILVDVVSCRMLLDDIEAGHGISIYEPWGVALY